MNDKKQSKFSILYQRKNKYVFYKDNDADYTIQLFILSFVTDKLDQSYQEIKASCCFLNDQDLSQNDFKQSCQILQMASPYILKNSPVHLIKFQSAWKGLTQQEQLYAYYFQKACWEGAKIAIWQRSFESPGLFMLLNQVFKGQPFQDYKQRVVEKLGDSEIWDNFVAYSAGVFDNMGNYFEFGNYKMFPKDINKDQFEEIIRLSQCPNKEEVLQIWSRIGEWIFDKNYPMVDFQDSKGLSSYYSPNVTKNEAELVTKFLQEVGGIRQALNTRLFKNSQNELIVKIPSFENHHLYKNQKLKAQQYEGYQIKFEKQDFVVFMERIVKYLTQALPYVANENQQQMIVEYIKHFITGDHEYHFNSQEYWVKDKSPTVETMIGYIENYQDPLRLRAEYEGFVSIVNKEKSKAYARLVDMANELIQLFPWPKEFEKSKFQAPDFTGLDVVAFATSGVPIGINLPNYKDIHESIGFKNVVLENVSPPFKREFLDFLKEEDIEILINNEEPISALSTALHELIGHGSGKMLTQKEGQFNFDPEKTISPITNEPVTTWYKDNQNFDSLFAEMKSGFEECRAEVTSLYMSCFNQVYSAFQISDPQKIKEVREGIWIEMVYAGIKSLKYYHAENQNWGQAHCRARFAILKVLMEEPEFLKIEFNESQDYFYMNLQKDKILSIGKAKISEFLQKLHIYRCSADVENGKSFFNKYSQVDEIFLKMRQVILKNEKPRRLTCQCHLFMNENSEIEIMEFPETHEGMVLSYVNRYSDFDQEAFKLWTSEWDAFKPLIG